MRVLLPGMLQSLRDLERSCPLLMGLATFDEAGHIEHVSRVTAVDDGFQEGTG